MVGRMRAKVNKPTELLGHDLTESSYLLLGGPLKRYPRMALRMYDSELDVRPNRRRPAFRRADPRPDVVANPHQAAVGWMLVNTEASLEP
jgi:hypothetical protein